MFKRSNPLVAITCYYNPCRYKTRRQNYDIFIQGLEKQKIPSITVECAFGNDPFELPDRNNIFKIRSQSLLWQKERLLNLAAQWLPPSCEFVSWLDCDILFENSQWGKDLIKVLQKNMVAQTWETCSLLNASGLNVKSTAVSFAKIMQANTPEIFKAGRYDQHGHTGYGWAMRREIFDEVGLYDLAVSGSADHHMAHAIYNDYGFCITNGLMNDFHQVSHLQQWGEKFYDRVRGRLGFVPGNIRHLWHGDSENRRYFLRMQDLVKLRYNPWTDIQSKSDAPLEWTQQAKMQKQELVQYFERYFSSRKEDDPYIAQIPD